MMQHVHAVLSERSVLFNSMIGHAIRGMHADVHVSECKPNNSLDTGASSGVFGGKHCQAHCYMTLTDASVKQHQATAFVGDHAGKA
jgi:hypothetical protein